MKILEPVEIDIDLEKWDGVEIPKERKEKWITDLVSDLLKRGKRDINYAFSGDTLVLVDYDPSTDRISVWSCKVTRAFLHKKVRP